MCFVFLVGVRFGVGFGLIQTCSQLPFSPHSKDHALHRCSGSFDNEKSGVHDHMPASFFRFNGMWKLQHSNCCNGDVSWGAHDSFFKGMQSASIVSVLILNVMTSFLANLIIDNNLSHLWRLSNERMSPISHGPFPTKLYHRPGTLHNSASPEWAAARTDQARELTSMMDPSRPQVPATAKAALESRYGPWEQPALII